MSNQLFEGDCSICLSATAAFKIPAPSILRGCLYRAPKLDWKLLQNESPVALPSIPTWLGRSTPLCQIPAALE